MHINLKGYLPYIERNLLHAKGPKYLLHVQMTSLQILFIVVVVMLNCSRCFSLPLPSSKGDLSIYTMDIQEPDGNRYQEIVGIDSERQLEFFGVPAYGNVDGADFLLDFEKNITMIRIPGLKACFMAIGIDSDIPRPRQLLKAFQQPSKTFDSIKIEQTKWRKTGAFTRRALLKPKMRKLCEGYPIYRITKDTQGRTGPIKRQNKTCGGKVCGVVNKCYQVCSQPKPKCKVCYNVPACSKDVKCE